MEEGLGGDHHPDGTEAALGKHGRRRWGRDVGSEESVLEGGRGEDVHLLHVADELSNSVCTHAC